MRLKIVLMAVLVWCAVSFGGAAYAQERNTPARSPEEIWREYRTLDSSAETLVETVWYFREPYLSFALRELTKVSLDATQLVEVLTADIPEYYGNIFWEKLKPQANTEEILRVIMSCQSERRCRRDSSWRLIDDLIKELLGRQLSPEAGYRLACYGPLRYQEFFWDKFWTTNPAASDVVWIINQSGGECQKRFLRELLDRRSLKKEDLSALLLASQNSPELYVRICNMLLSYPLDEHELDTMAFFGVEPFASLARQLRDDAGHDKKRALLDLMQKPRY